MPVWADLLLTFGAAVFFAAFFAAVIEKANARVARPHLESAQRHLEHVQKVNQATLQMLRRKSR